MELWLKNDFRGGGSKGGRELNTLINFDHTMDLKEKFYIFSYGFGVK